MRRIFVILSVCLTTLGWSQTATVSGQIKDGSGTVITSNAFLRFELKGGGGNQCRYNADSAIDLTKPLDKAVNATTGALSGNIFRNDSITCGTSTTSNFWRTTWWRNGQAGPPCDVRITSGTFDATQPSCLNVTPTVTAPTGDNTYCRLDATNCGFTGNITGLKAAFTHSGIFTNTQQNNYLTSIVGTLNFGTRYSTQQGGNFATEAIAGGVQCSGTVHQCNGVAGYVQSTSTTPYPVALYGQAEIGIAGGKAYGLNTVSADTASLAGTVVGGEVDVNISNAASTGVGMSLQGVFAAQPTSANAFNFGKPTGGHWQNGLVFNGGFTNNTCAGGGTCGVIVLNQSSIGASQDSQQILFNSSAQSSLLRMLDTNGFLFHNIGYIAPAFSSSGTNPSSAGTLRLEKTAAIGWRNNANGGDNLLGQDANDHLTFAGLTVAQMTVTLKTGSGGGNYTASNTTYANVDTTNLCSVVTIPTGSKLIIQAVGTGLTSTAAVNFLVSIADIGTTCGGAGTTPLQEAQIGAVSTANPTSYALAWVVNGDGAAHAISMQAKTTAGADAWVIANSSATLKPSMILTLTPSN